MRLFGFLVLRGVEGCGTVALRGVASTSSARWIATCGAVDPGSPRRGDGYDSNAKWRCCGVRGDRALRSDVEAEAEPASRVRDDRGMSSVGSSIDLSEVRPCFDVVSRSAASRGGEGGGENRNLWIGEDMATAQTRTACLTRVGASCVRAVKGYGRRVDSRWTSQSIRRALGAGRGSCQTRRVVLVR